MHAEIEDELSLDKMAEAAGLSAAHFSQMFRKSTGESPHQFVLRLKVERAKEMLRAPKPRVLDVAIACGFKTQQRFARVFRRACGACPSFGLGRVLHRSTCCRRSLMIGMAS